MNIIIQALTAGGWRLRQRGQTWMARCPCHGNGGGDSSPSLSLREEGGKPLIYCFAGCTSDAVLSQLGLSWKQVLGSTERISTTRRTDKRTETSTFVERVPANAPKVPDRILSLDGQPPESVYRYRDVTGLLCYGVLRFPKKEIRPLTLWRDKSTGSLEWRWMAPQGRRVLYGAHTIGERKDAPVLCVEGEKTADAARLIFPEFNVVSWMGGAGALDRSDWSILKGRDVTLWPDADEAGVRCMDKLAVELKVCRMVEVLPELSGGWDLADEVPAGFDVRAAVEAAWSVERWDRDFLVRSGRIVRPWEQVR